jgi:hypothetical protein
MFSEFCLQALKGEGSFLGFLGDRCLGENAKVEILIVQFRLYSADV